MSSSTAQAFAIEGEFSIYRAAELAHALQAWWPQACEAGAVALDLSHVSEMDSAGLQLLLSAQRSALAQGLNFQITAASDAAAQVLQLCALQSWLPAEAGEQTP